MIAIPVQWYVGNWFTAMVYFTPMKAFIFFGIDKKVPPVLLWTEIALLNKYFNQNIEINNLYMDLES